MDDSGKINKKSAKKRKNLQNASSGINNATNQHPASVSNHQWKGIDFKSHASKGQDTLLHICAIFTHFSRPLFVIIRWILLLFNWISGLLLIWFPYIAVLLLGCYLILILFALVKYGHSIAMDASRNIAYRSCNLILPQSVCDVFSAAPPEVRDLSGMIPRQSVLVDKLAALQLPSREISKAKQAIADLSVVVKYSDLKFKDIIVRQLFEFSKEAQSTSDSLAELQISARGCLENLIIANTHARDALRKVESASAGQSDNYFSLLLGPSSAFAELSSSYNYILSRIESELRRLIDLAQDSRVRLMDLEGRLRSVHEALEQEKVALRGDEPSTVDRLWETLGMKNLKVGKMTPAMYDENRLLLENLGKARLVAATRLQEILDSVVIYRASLEELRMVTVEPAFFTTMISIQIESIERGISHLSRHLESIDPHRSTKRIE